MTRSVGYGLLACLIIGWNIAAAGEVEELRERAGQLKQKAAALMESGDKAEAERLLKEAAELGERAQILERHEKASQPRHHEEQLQLLHARLKELRYAHRELWAAHANDEEIVDIRQHIRRVEAQIAAHEGRPHPPEAMKHLEEIRHRIEHLRAAAEHVEAAKMPDVAHSLRERAQDMERAAREMLEQLEKKTASPPPNAEGKSVEQKLREEVEALRKELETLRKQQPQK